MEPVRSIEGEEGGAAEYQTLPHNIEAEQALLGAILINNEALNRVSAFLAAEHFFERVHGRIFEAATKLIERGQIEFGMIVVGESSRSVVEATVRRLAEPGTDESRLRAQLATLTLGSGSAAMILAHARCAPDGHAFLGTVSLADTAFHNLCLGTADEGLTDTQKLLIHGVALAKRTWQRAVETLLWPLDSVDLFAIHQVSGPHTEALARAVGFDPSRAHPIYPEQGNVGPASIPIVLGDADEQDMLSPGDRVILGGIGSGLNCTVGAVIW